CRMIHYTLTFGDRELAEQKECLTRFSGDPVGVATPGIEECRLRCTGGLPGKLDQLILDFKRTQRLKVAKLHKIHFHVFSFQSHRDIRMMITIPQMVRKVLPTA